MTNRPAGFLDRQMSRIKRDATPPWWTLAQVLTGAVFALALAWNIMADTGTPDVPPAASPAPSTPSDPTPTEEPTPDTPAPTDPPTTPDTQVTVTSTSGVRQVVPAAAYELAKVAFAATYDPAAAAEVPLTGGGTLPAPAEPAPAATVDRIALALTDGDRLTFVAAGDPDGQGPKPGEYLTRTVVKDGDRWVLDSPQ